MLDCTAATFAAIFFVLWVLDKVVPDEPSEPVRHVRSPTLTFREVCEDAYKAGRITDDELEYLAAVHKNTFGREW